MKKSHIDAIFCAWVLSSHTQVLEKIKLKKPYLQYSATSQNHSLTVLSKGYY